MIQLQLVGVEGWEQKNTAMGCKNTHARPPAPLASMIDDRGHGNPTAGSSKQINCLATTDEQQPRVTVLGLHPAAKGAAAAAARIIGVLSLIPYSSEQAVDSLPPAAHSLLLVRGAAGHKSGPSLNCSCCCWLSSLLKTQDSRPKTSCR